MGQQKHSKSQNLNYEDVQCRFLCFDYQKSNFMMLKQLNLEERKPWKIHFLKQCQLLKDDYEWAIFIPQQLKYIKQNLTLESKCKNAMIRIYQNYDNASFNLEEHLQSKQKRQKAQILQQNNINKKPISHSMANNHSLNDSYHHKHPYYENTAIQKFNNDKQIITQSEYQSFVQRKQSEISLKSALNSAKSSRMGSFAQKPNPNMSDLNESNIKLQNYISNIVFPEGIHDQQQGIKGLSPKEFQQLQKSAKKQYANVTSEIAKQINEEEIPLKIIKQIFSDYFVFKYGNLLNQFNANQIKFSTFEQVNAKLLADLKSFIDSYQEAMCLYYQLDILETRQYQFLNQRQNNIQSTISCFSKDNLVNFTTRMIFSTELYSLVFQFQRNLDQKHEDLLTKGFYLCFNAKPQDIKLPPTLCLNSVSYAHCATQLKSALKRYESTNEVGNNSSFEKKNQILSKSAYIQTDSIGGVQLEQISQINQPMIDLKIEQKDKLQLQLQQQQQPQPQPAIKKVIEIQLAQVQTDLGSQCSGSAGEESIQSNPGQIIKEQDYNIKLKKQKQHLLNNVQKDAQNQSSSGKKAKSQSYCYQHLNDDDEELLPTIANEKHETTMKIYTQHLQNSQEYMNKSSVPFQRENITNFLANFNDQAGLNTVLNIQRDGSQSYKNQLEVQLQFEIQKQIQEKLDQMEKYKKIAEFEQLQEKKKIEQQKAQKKSKKSDQQNNMHQNQNQDQQYEKINRRSSSKQSEGMCGKTGDILEIRDDLNLHLKGDLHNLQDNIYKNRVWEQMAKQYSRIIDMNAESQNLQQNQQEDNIQQDSDQKQEQQQQQIQQQEMSYLPAIECLREIQFLTSPVDKLKVLVKTSEVVLQCIKNFYRELNIQFSKKLDGEDVMNIFFYIVSKSNVKSFYTHIMIIENFISDNERCSIAGYYLNKIQMCLKQLEDLSELKMNFPKLISENHDFNRLSMQLDTEY